MNVVTTAVLSGVAARVARNEQYYAMEREAPAPFDVAVRILNNPRMTACYAKELLAIRNALTEKTASGVRLSRHTQDLYRKLQSLSELH